jgi:hypothetical protein
VLSLDPKVGAFEKADVLVEGKKISALGPNLDAGRSALIVDASDHIVLPGFVDTHHHQYETLLRSILSDGNLGLTADSPTNYIQGILTPAYRPSQTPAGMFQLRRPSKCKCDTACRRSKRRSIMRFARA